jgi:hypothetical protein
LINGKRSISLHLEVEVNRQATDITSTDKPLSDFRNHDHGVGLKARLDHAIETALQDKRIVGTVVLVAEGGDIVYGRAAGFADREAGRPMEENCIFLLSSWPSRSLRPRRSGCVEARAGHRHSAPRAGGANELTVVALTNTAFEGMIGRFTVDVRNAVYGV